MRPATFLNVERFRADTVVQHFPFRIEIRKPVTDLIVREDSVVDGTEAAVDAAARALREEDLKILVLFDGVQAFVAPLQLNLFFGPKQ